MPPTESESDLPTGRYGTEGKGTKGTYYQWDDSYGFLTVTDFTYGREVKSATIGFGIGPSNSEIWH